jgi:UDP-N-acetylglucosamine--N-acetylmuramyl-(pentapeptide) pyrophosphoryl-undecaprenol N-acetylglucosamine transferase
MRIVLTGGGSGGHLYPLVALGEEARRRYADVRCLYVGSRYGVEARRRLPNDWEVCLLPVRGLRGKRPWAAVWAGLGLVWSVRQAYRYLRSWRPDVVVSSGGYAGVAASVAARWLGVPVFLHEQNVTPGWATRWISRWARGLALTYPIEGSWPCPVKTVGNPVRREFFELPWERPPWPPFRVLVVGGSQGSRLLNAVVPTALAQVHRLGYGVEVVHQAGPHEVDAVQVRYRQAGIPARVADFLDPIGPHYGWAHVVVSRAGSTTLAEIAAARMTAVLVPLEGVAGDHQWANAQYWAERGAALVFRSTAAPEDLARLLMELYNRPDRWREVRERAGRLAWPHAARAFWEWVESLHPSFAKTSLSPAG